MVEAGTGGGCASDFGIAAGGSGGGAAGALGFESFGLENGKRNAMTGNLHEEARGGKREKATGGARQNCWCSRRRLATRLAWDTAGYRR